MGHSSTTNYTISQSITTEQNGDSVIAGTLPNQAGNGSVILTITPNLGFTVNSSDFTIGGVAADSTSNLTSTLTNFSTGNLLSSIQYNFIGSSSGGNSVSLPSEVKNVVIFNSEFNFDATANTFLPVTANNVVFVHVFFMDTFQMPAQNTTLNIDIDGSATADNAIQYPAAWETWTGPTNSDYTISVTGNPLLTNMNLSQSTNSNTALNNISGLVDDGVQTLLMTKVFTAATGKYFTEIIEQEQFSAFGLVDWLPYFDTQITSQVFNTNGEETSRTIEFYYTNPPISSGLDPTFGGNTFGLGFLFEYIVGTQATVYPLTGGGTGGISPLAPNRPFGGLVNITSSSELGGSVEDVNPAVTTIPDNEFFGKITNVVLDTDREINAKGGETRSLTLYGTAGATYSISISNGSNTYDDNSDTFTAGATTIDSEIGSEGSTTHEIVFPAVGSTTTYTFTLSSRFGTALPANITDGVSGNIGSITSSATKTFTLAFASASDISASMPSDLVFSFAELNNETASNTFKVEITGDVGEEFSSVDAILEAPDATAVAAMSVTSGSASGWEWAMSGFNITHNFVSSETNRDSMVISGTITVQTLGSSSVKYTLALDTITNVS